MNKEQLFNENYQQFNSCITYHLNKKYFNYKEDHADLRQDVLMKLYAALEKFDEAKAKLITFANTVIINTLSTLIVRLNKHNQRYGLAEEYQLDKPVEEINIFEKAAELLDTLTLTKTERMFLTLLVNKMPKNHIKIELNLDDNYIAQLVYTIRKKVVNREY